MPEIDLEKQLLEEREKLRLNAVRVLKFLGYTNDVSKLTQEELDARIELLMERKENAKIEATKKGKPGTPAFFSGIDEEKENIEAVKNAAPSELDQSEFMEGYDALTALIPILRPNSQVGHAKGYGDEEDIRIIRLPATIQISNTKEIFRRVVL